MRIIGIILGIVLLQCGSVYASVEGDISMNIGDDYENGFVRVVVTGKDAVQNMDYRQMVSIDRQAQNGERVKNEFIFENEVKKDIVDKVTGNIKFRYLNDDIRRYDRTEVSGGIGGSIEKGKMRIEGNGNIGYSWSGAIEDDIVGIIEGNVRYGGIYDRVRLLSPIDDADGLEIRNEVGIEKVISEKVNVKVAYVTKYYRAYDDENILRVMVGIRI